MKPSLSLHGNENSDVGLESALPETLTLRANDHVCLRLYSDTRPHCLETATLQKGLVLVLDGVELIEEGMGFGAPVSIYRDEPYFSSTAICKSIGEGDSRTLVKSFVMDTVSRKRIGEAAYFNGGFYSLIHRVFHKFYTSNTTLTPVFNRFIDSASLIGVSTEFIKVKPRGTVNVKYSLRDESVVVEASFNNLEKLGYQQTVVLNEQGAGFFKRYSDSNGQILEDTEIGAWVEVKAGEAALSDCGGTMGFSLKKTSNAVLFRGREAIKGRYSWVGLSYSLGDSNTPFKYAIKLKI
jgi:hypothetical protein